MEYNKWYRLLEQQISDIQRHNSCVWKQHLCVNVHVLFMSLACFKSLYPPLCDITPNTLFPSVSVSGCRPSLRALQ